MQKRDPAQRERIFAESITPTFEIRVGELAKLAGIAGKNYQRIYEAMDELLGLKLSWNVVNESNDVVWNMKGHFLGTWGLGVGEHKGVVRFTIESSVLGFVMEPSTWAALSLDVMKGLKSTASYSLYQNTFRYVGTAHKVTAALPTDTWINLIMGGPSRYVTGAGADLVVL